MCVYADGLGFDVAYFEMCDAVVEPDEGGDSHDAGRECVVHNARDVSQTSVCVHAGLDYDEHNGDVGSKEGGFTCDDDDSGRSGAAGVSAKSL